MNRKVFSFLVISFLVLLVLILIPILMVGCGERSTKQEAVVIIKSLYAPSSIQKGKTETVDVEVKDQNNRPLSGVKVSFSVRPSSIGYFTPAVDTTDANGLAASVFTATALGTATIEVSAEGSQSKTAQIEVISAGETTKRIEIEITPPWLPADGIATSTVKATIRDSTGNVVANGTLVKFVAGEDFDDVDGDGYFTEGVDQLKFDTNGDGKWNPMGIIPPYAFTQNGIAQVKYTTGFRTGTAFIKVTTGPAGQQVQDYTTILLIPTDTVAYIVLTSDHSSIQVKGTGGVEATQITATCYDNNGNRVTNDFPVEFYIINGPGGGEKLDGQEIYPVTIKTNSFGEATVTMLSGTKSGPVKLRAKIGTLLSASTLVTICAGPPTDISLSPYYCNIPACEVACVIDTICACVVDRYGNPVPDSTSVHFGTEEGMVYCCDKTKQGCAYSVYVSGDPRNDCIALVWAETWGEDGIISDTCTIILSGDPTSVTFLDYPSTILADGISEGHVLIEVLDANDYFVVNSTPVEMHSVFGSVASGVTKNGCDASLFQTYLVSEVLTEDYSMKYTDRDDSVGVISLLTAKSGVESTTVSVIFLTGNTFSEKCEIGVERRAIPVGATVPVVVFVKDAYGNPLGGHYIVGDQAHSWRGTITGSYYTNAFGEATGFFFKAEAVGAGIIAFYDEDPKGGVCIAFNVQIVP